MQDFPLSFQPILLDRTKQLWYMITLLEPNTIPKRFSFEASQCSLWRQHQRFGRNWRSSRVNIYRKRRFTTFVWQLSSFLSSSFMYFLWTDHLSSSVFMLPVQLYCPIKKLRPFAADFNVNLWPCSLHQKSTSSTSDYFNYSYFFPLTNNPDFLPAAMCTCFTGNIKRSLRLGECATKLNRKAVTNFWKALFQFQNCPCLVHAGYIWSIRHSFLPVVSSVWVRRTDIRKNTQSSAGCLDIQLHLTVHSFFLLKNFVLSLATDLSLIANGRLVLKHCWKPRRSERRISFLLLGEHPTIRHCVYFSVQFLTLHHFAHQFNQCLFISVSLFSVWIPSMHGSINL